MVEYTFSKYNFNTNYGSSPVMYQGTWSMVIVSSSLVYSTNPALVHNKSRHISSVMSELLCCLCENPNNFCNWSVLGLKPLVN